MAEKTKLEEDDVGHHGYCHGHCHGHVSLFIPYMQQSENKTKQNKKQNMF